VNPTIEINKSVDVITKFCVNGTVNSRVVPCKMLFGGREIVFTKLGMLHPTGKGKKMIHVFDVSDENNDYRLEFDAERLSWTLMAIVPGGSDG